jgi:SEC-C motif-containing protein
MDLINCPCGSGMVYQHCCQPYHLKVKTPATAEALMRSRYSAFVIADADYLYETTHISKRKNHSKNAYLNSAKNTKWLKLEIVFSDFDVVEFKAFYLNKKFQTEVLHEKSNFKLEDGKWYYVDGEFYE